MKCSSSPNVCGLLDTSKPRAHKAREHELARISKLEKFLDTISPVRKIMRMNDTEMNHDHTSNLRPNIVRLLLDWLKAVVSYTEFQERLASVTN